MSSSSRVSLPSSQEGAEQQLSTPLDLGGMARSILEAPYRAEPEPSAIVEMAYRYADALKAADAAADLLWKHLPADRQVEFEAGNIDTFAAERAVRRLADAWQDEIDGTAS